MVRHFAPILISELEKKVNELVGEEGLHLSILREKLEKDLKVEFDGENFSRQQTDFGPEDLMGYRTLEKTGLTYLGLSAGGDWEHPVFFVLYWDGKHVRAYIPTLGNPWNTDTKQAYGNDAKKDLKNAKKRWPDLYDKADEEIEPEDFDFTSHEIFADMAEHLVLKPSAKSSKRLSLKERMSQIIAENERKELEKVVATAADIKKLAAKYLAEAKAVVEGIPKAAKDALAKGERYLILVNGEVLQGSLDVQHGVTKHVIDLITKEGLRDKLYLDSGAHEFSRTSLNLRLE